MEIDYSITFPEDTGFCLHTPRSDKLITPSTAFTVHLNKVRGRDNPRDITYWAYVCKLCGLPTQWYIQYCMWCMDDFYGPPDYNTCLKCLTQPEG